MSPPEEADEPVTLFERPAHEMLLVLGSLLAVLLGSVFFVLSVLGETSAVDALPAALVDVVLGVLLLVALPVLRRRRINGALLALVSSILLIALGGLAGVIGGLFGLVGGLIALLPAYKDFLP